MAGWVASGRCRLGSLAFQEAQLMLKSNKTNKHIPAPPSSGGYWIENTSSGGPISQPLGGAGDPSSSK